MGTLVLDHGGWHGGRFGGWCWRRGAARLRAGGRTVHTPTLDHIGEREHLFTPASGPHMHAQDVSAVLRFERQQDVAQAHVDALMATHPHAGTRALPGFVTAAEPAGKASSRA